MPSSTSVLTPARGTGPCARQTVPVRSRSWRAPARGGLRRPRRRRHTTHPSRRPSPSPSFSFSSSRSPPSALETAAQSACWAWQRGVGADTGRLPVVVWDPSASASAQPCSQQTAAVSAKVSGANVRTRGRTARRCRVKHREIQQRASGA